MSNMTAQEAAEKIRFVLRFKGAVSLVDYNDVLLLALKALESSIPRVLTLDEARALEPHTAIYAEFLNHPDVITGPYAVGTILNKGGFPQYGKTVRWWTAWPGEELRKATKWEGAEKSKEEIGAPFDEPFYNTSDAREKDTEK